MYIVSNAVRNEFKSKYTKRASILFFLSSIPSVIYIMNYDIEIIGDNDKEVLYFGIYPALLSMILTLVLCRNFIYLIFKHDYSLVDKIKIIIKDLYEICLYIAFSVGILGYIIWKETNLYTSRFSPDRVEWVNVSKFEKYRDEGNYYCRVNFKYKNNPESLDCSCKYIDSLLDKNVDDYQLQIFCRETFWNHKIVHEWEIIKKKLN